MRTNLKVMLALGAIALSALLVQIRTSRDLASVTDEWCYSARFWYLKKVASVLDRADNFDSIWAFGEECALKGTPFFSKLGIESFEYAAMAEPSVNSAIFQVSIYTHRLACIYLHHGERDKNLHAIVPLDADRARILLFKCIDADSFESSLLYLRYYYQKDRIYCEKLLSKTWGLLISDLSRYEKMNETERQEARRMFGLHTSLRHRFREFSECLRDLGREDDMSLAAHLADEFEADR